MSYCISQNFLKEIPASDVAKLTMKIGGRDKLFRPFILTYTYANAKEGMQNHRYFIVKPIQNKKLVTFLHTTQKELGAFFGFKIAPPSVFFVQSRQDINKIRGRRTENWMVAWVDNRGGIFILDPKVYVQESDHKDRASFWKVLKHEYCHLYFRHLTGTNFPKWLSEGLTCYLAGQVKGPPPKEKILNVLSYYRNSDKNVYAVGYFWVKLLIEKFGRPKLLKLLKNIRPRTMPQKFASNFYRIYRFHFKKRDLKRIAGI